MVRAIYSFANNAMQIKIVTSDIRYDGLFLKKFLTEIKKRTTNPSTYRIIHSDKCQLKSQLVKTKQKNSFRKNSSWYLIFK